MRWVALGVDWPRRPCGIRPGHVEVAQHDGRHVVRLDRVGEHPFHHQLGAAVGVDRRQRDVLRHGTHGRLAVDGGGGGEDEVPDLGLDGALDEAARLCGVVEVVAERVGDRFGHHDLGGEVGDGIDRMVGHDAGHQCRIAEIAFNKDRARRYRPAEPGRQVVEHHDAFAGIEQGQNHVTADIAGAPRNQNAHDQAPPNSKHGARRVSNLRSRLRVVSPGRLDST